MHLQLLTCRELGSRYLTHPVLHHLHPSHSPLLSHWLCCLGDNDRLCTRTEVGFIISLRRTPRTKWEHTVGPIGDIVSKKRKPRNRKPRHVGTVFRDGIQVYQFTRCVGVVRGAEVVYC